ncbi:unnamed protein product [Polarella glacialis]|uniref:Uncharacterized protein n=1 Tax=Polarella glacialis TaxID=89957 RepID=A0A813LN14_POLGL|nr:unnamed protein product [Polarella glacialis]
MGYASYARYARCRSANLSSWARQMNWAMDGSRRGLAGASMARMVCSETLPSMSFAEQRMSGSAGGSVISEMSACELSSKCNSIASIIDGLSGPGAIQLSELLGLATRWVSYPTFEKGICQHRIA